MNYKLIQRITLEVILASKPRTIFYGANTCWWTHDPNHLGNTRDFPSRSSRTSDETGPGLPCDPRGGVLLQTDDVEGFLRSAQENADHYGPFGMDTFLAAHHLNCVAVQAHFFGDTEAPWCFRTWDEYTTILRAQGGKLLDVAALSSEAGS